MHDICLLSGLFMQGSRGDVQHRTDHVALDMF